MAVIGLHLRTLTGPHVGTRTLIESCRRVFRQAEVSIQVRSRQTLRLSRDEQTRFIPLRIAAGCRGARTTIDQTTLFGLVPGIDEREVVVLFVHSTDKAVNGCAQHPADRPGVIVSALCGKWTLAHELGHLLGLPHVRERSRLMFGNGTIGITADPPALMKPEIELIRGNAHGLLR